jgi:intraflagellar transport protein 80
MLACIADGKLLTWFYPNAVYVDKDLMNKAMASKDASDVGKLAHMTSFTGNFCSVRRLDGA